MLRFASEGNWEEFKKEWDGLPAQEKRKFNKNLNDTATREFHFLAYQQILELTGQEKKGEEPSVQGCFTSTSTLRMASSRYTHR